MTVADPVHLAFPLRLSAGGVFDTVPQGGDDEIRQNVHTIARTPLGQRSGRPEFGVPDVTFTTGFVPSQLEALLEQQEPEAIVEVDDTMSDPLQGLDWLHVRAGAREAPDG